jgi:hypothetical protein
MQNTTKADKFNYVIHLIIRSLFYGLFGDNANESKHAASRHLPEVSK